MRLVTVGVARHQVRDLRQREHEHEVEEQLQRGDGGARADRLHPRAPWCGHATIVPQRAGADQRAGPAAVACDPPRRADERRGQRGHGATSSVPVGPCVFAPPASPPATFQDTAPGASNGPIGATQEPPLRCIDVAPVRPDESRHTSSTSAGLPLSTAVMVERSGAQPRTPIAVGLADWLTTDRFAPGAGLGGGCCGGSTGAGAGGGPAGGRTVLERSCAPALDGGATGAGGNGAELGAADGGAGGGGLRRRRPGDGHGDGRGRGGRGSGGRGVAPDHDDATGEREHDQPGHDAGVDPVPARRLVLFGRSSETLPSTSSRSTGGADTCGAAASNTSGLGAVRRDSSHVGHWPTCAATRWTSRGVSRPVQPTSTRSSRSQPGRFQRVTRRAMKLRSTRSRTRSSCRPIRRSLMPAAAASSVVLRPWRRCRLRSARSRPETASSASEARCSSRACSRSSSDAASVVVSGSGCLRAGGPRAAQRLVPRGGVEPRLEVLPLPPPRQQCGQLPEHLPDHDGGPVVVAQDRVAEVVQPVGVPLVEGGERARVAVQYALDHDRVGELRGGGGSRDHDGDHTT